MGEVVNMKAQMIGSGVHVSPDQIMSHQIGKLTEIVLIDVNLDGEVIIAGSEGVERALWLLESAKKDMLP